MVRMAKIGPCGTTWLTAKGNFGSIDSDNPAAMRYTEARLRKVAEDMLADLEKETVDFRPNFDESLKEPTVLPAKIPNLLVNGAAGIAVGMAATCPLTTFRKWLMAWCTWWTTPIARWMT